MPPRPPPAPPFTDRRPTSSRNRHDRLSPGPGRHRPAARPGLYRRPMARRRRRRPLPGARPGGPEPDHRGGGRRRHGHRPRHRRRRPRSARLAPTARQGTFAAAAPLVRSDGRAQGRPGPAAEPRTGQAAGGKPGRDRLRRQLHRMVRRGSQARQRRVAGRRPTRAATGHPETAGGRGGGHHPLEFPLCHGHPQGRPGPGGGLHPGAQAGPGNAAVGAGLGGTGAPRRPARRGVQCGAGA